MRIVYVCDGIVWRTFARLCVFSCRRDDLMLQMYKSKRRFRNQHNDLKSSKEWTHAEQCDRELKFPHCDIEWQVVWRTVTFEVQKYLNIFFIRAFVKCESRMFRFEVCNEKDLFILFSALFIWFINLLIFKIFPNF